MKTYPVRTCEVCRESWQPATRYQAARNKTCSPECAAKAISAAKIGRPQPHLRKRTTLTCPVCETSFEIHTCRLKRVEAPTCSRQCNGALRGAEWATHGHKGRAAWTDASRASYTSKMSGANNPAWKGGVTYWRKKGNYPSIKYVRAPAWVRPMARKDGYIMEHRMLMAQRIGRLLTRTEVVHHLDHDPTNNALTNLELWPTNGSHRAAEGGRVVVGVANRLSLPFTEVH